MRALNLPQEIEYWYIIPCLRGRIAKGLLDRGLKRKQIAETLGISQAAVSHYIKKKRANEVILTKYIEKQIALATDIICKKKNTLEFIRQVGKLNQLTKEQGILCRLHKKFNRNLPRNCSLCEYRI